jgi:hypothetical protein
LCLCERGLGIPKMKVPQRRDAIVRTWAWPGYRSSWLMQGRTVDRFRIPGPKPLKSNAS